MSRKNNLRVQSSNEARKNGKKGGIASGRARRKKKQLKEAMRALLDMDIEAKGGEKITGTEALATKAFQAALKGDWRAWELVRDTAGEKPVDKIMKAEVDIDTIMEIEEMINGNEESNR